jgi:MSHA pilin protein MshD
MSHIYPDAVRQSGVSLVEVIIFIMVVAVAIAGVLGAFNVATRSSVDPMAQKQALAIAESLLEEIELMPFTNCDPDDANAANAALPAVGAGNCTTTVEATAGGGGPEAGETRYAVATPFDNVNDYNGFAMVGIRDITNTAIPALALYNANVVIAQQALGGVPAADSLLITVSVTGPQGAPAGLISTVVLQGIRTRYAPRALP